MENYDKYVFIRDQPDEPSSISKMPVWVSQGNMCFSSTPYLYTRALWELLSDVNSNMNEQYEAL